MNYEISIVLIGIVMGVPFIIGLLYQLYKNPVKR